MIKKFAFLLSVFALAIALGASSYTVNLPKPAIVNGTELKAGDYKVEVKGNKATLKNGKTVIETDVNVENLPSKSYQSSACCLADDGKYRLQELRLAGTNMKLTIKEAGKDNAASGH